MKNQSRYRQIRANIINTIIFLLFAFFSLRAVIHIFSNESIMAIYSILLTFAFLVIATLFNRLNDFENFAILFTDVMTEATARHKKEKSKKGKKDDSQN